MPLNIFTMMKPPTGEPRKVNPFLDEEDDEELFLKLEMSILKKTPLILMIHYY